jgi:serine/threonine protein phosphatase PrpC
MCVCVCVCLFVFLCVCDCALAVFVVVVVAVAFVVVVVASLQPCPLSVAQIDGTLSVSRAFGDFDYKPTDDSSCKVIVEPHIEVMFDNFLGGSDHHLSAYSCFFFFFTYALALTHSICQLRDRSSNDQFLVLATDGVFDVMTNDVCCKFISAKLAASEPLSAICDALLAKCMELGSKDNLTVIIATLH